MTEVGSWRPYYLEQIEEFCREHPVGRKILIVPSRQIGYNILTALALSGFSWLNLEPMTAADHAESTYGPRLRSVGLKPVKTDTAHVIVTDLLRSLKTRRGNYFEPVAVTPSLVRSVWGTLRSIRDAGVGADRIAERLRAGAKAEALRFLVKGFERALTDLKLYDGAMLFRFAGETGPANHTVSAILEETRLTALEAEYVRETFGSSIRLIGRSDFGLTDPIRSARSLFGHARADAGRVGPAGRIRSPGLGPVDAADVVVWGAGGPEAEVNDILRHAVKSGIPFDEIEIAYSRSAVYQPLVIQASQRFGVPVTFAEGTPVNLSRPGRALTGILHWIIEGFPVRGLADLLQAGLVGFHRIVPDMSVGDNQRVASLLLECPIGEGRDRYQRGLKAIRTNADADLEAGWSVSENRMRALGYLETAVTRLLGMVPEAETITLGQTAGFCVDVIRDLAMFSGDQDTVASESLTDRLLQIQSTPPMEVGLNFACQFMADLVDSHKAQAAVAKPGAIHAVPIDRAGYAGRKHLFIVGLDVDNFPGRVSEDPILLDFEREVVSASLGVMARQATDAVWDLLRVGGMAAGKAYLSTSVFNAEREDVTVYPSPILQQAAKDLGLDYVKPPPLSGAGLPLSPTQALLPQRRRADFREFCGAVYPSLRAGATAIHARASGCFTRFDGWIGDAQHRFLITAEHPVFSARKLEDLAACPHRFFLNDVLFIRKPKYYEFDTSRWLSPLEFGSLLHELYQRFLITLRDRGERASLELHWPLLASMLEKLIDEYRSRIPVDNQSAYEFERRRLELSARAFLKVESEDQTSAPLRFELSFGMQDADREALRQPVLLALGNGLKISLRGRVDRIDQTPEGLAIWDYKTGGSWRYRQGDLSRGGLNLQWVIYAHAVNAIADEAGLPERVVTAGYYFANDRENGRRISEQVPDPTETGTMLSPLFGMVNAGAFLHVNKAKNECTYCDFSPICATESKLHDDIDWIENMDNPAMVHVQDWLQNAEDDDE